MIGTTLNNRYEVIGELGRGGMGVVYRARDPLLNREVAVKLVPPMMLTAQSEERFQREAQLVAQMDHPSIVPIFDIGQHEGSMFFLMPVVRGANLRAFLREKPRGLGEIVDIAIQAAEGLEYSHARGVIHRDIKPENIMVSEEEGVLRVRIMDFGLAKAASDQRLTRTGTLIGTVSYFSPEQVKSQEIDHRSDIYSLGTVLYEAIAGEPPFTGEMQSVLYRVVHENPRSLIERGADISQELEDVVMRSLVKEPARRYQSAAALAEALRRYRSTLRESDVGRAIGLSSIMTAQMARPAAPFIGREKEIAELQRTLNAAVDGECQFAVVAGEPGIGKTRLVEEIEHLARARKITVLHGRFMEQDRTFAYQGFCEAIQEFFRSPDTGGSGARPDVSDLAPDLIALFPVLSEISELREARSGDHTLQAGESRKAEDRTWVFELLARTIVRIGGGKPLVLVFENLHAAELSLDALQYIVRRLGPTPTLIVGTYRQTEIDKRHPLVKMLDSFADDPRFLSLYIGPLTPSEHLSFIQTMVGGSTLGGDLAARLYEATEANPFFTRELVRSLIDSGGIARGETGEWNLSGEMAISSDALPATIQQTVEKRIERLPEDLREILSTASVMGRSFDFRDLEALADSKGNLDDVADRLVYEGLIEEERESRGDRLAFSSGIVRDVLYSALSRRKRKSLHRRYAELLEKRNSGRLERVYPQLVHHFSEGDVPDKTVEYGMILACRSLDAFGSEEALQTLRSVVEFLDDDEWNPAPGTAGQVRMLMARAMRQQGQFDSALREAETAVQNFELDNDRPAASAAMLLAAETAWQGRRVDETRKWLDQGIAAARATGSSNVLPDLLSLAATVANLRGEYAKAKELLDELEQLRPRETAQDAASAIPTGGKLTVALGNPSPAREPGEIALLEESETLGLVFERLVATDDRGHLVASLGESWDVIDEGRAMRLKLRQGVRFHDGTPLTAQSVKDSIEESVRSRRRETAAWAVIAGFDELRDGTSDHMSGIVVEGESDLEIRLRESLPIYPALLTDAGTGIVHASVDSSGKRTVAGTGAFAIVEHDPERIVMEKNSDYWMPGRPRLDAIEFRVVRNASSRAALLRSGEIDLGRELLSNDLDELLRDPRFRNGLQEVPNKITYFAVFNHTSRYGGNDALRRALCGVLPVHDLVWESLGRLAQPTTTLIPPGILGHDPGRRRHPISREAAAELLAASGLELPLTLRAAVHPLYQDRYRALTEAMFEIWAGLGVHVDIATPTLESFMDSYHQDEMVDLRIMRWAADYDDPDTYAYGLFHSVKGIVSRYFSSPAIDALIGEGRAERRPAAREIIYRRFEQAISESGSVLPLFHEIDYRLANPFVRGLSLRSTPPFVNYSDLGKASQAPATSPSLSGGAITIPIGGVLSSMEPTVALTFEAAETLSAVFETLTRIREGARAVPWLASSVTQEDGGRRYRIKLREDVRFHDGRRMSARDVRFTFERIFTLEASRAAWFYKTIKGATELMEGRARELEGLQIVSSHEILIELERPLAFFPTLLSHPTSGILPEGTQTIGNSWTSGCVGTGAFRVVAFDPGRRLELERNPFYWRTGYPKSDSLVFRFGVGSDEIRETFQAGEFSLASDLRPSDVEAFRHDPAYAPGYREVPRLSIYFAVFNRNRGPLADSELRRHLVSAVDVKGIVQRHLGRLAIPAHGVIPPGLLGYEPSAPGSGSHRIRSDKPFDVELTATVHPIFFGQYAAVGKELFEAFAERGVRIRIVHKTMDEYMESLVKAEADLQIGRWFADYPDADSFAHGLVHRYAGNTGAFAGSEEIDRLCERGREESDPAARHAIYQQIEKIVSRDALLLPLFHEQIYRIARPELEGLELNLAPPEVQYEDLRIRR